MADHFSDILVIGGGMAGISIASHLAEHARVRVLEMESHPGYHSTGRSAALFTEAYGNPVIRSLSRASRPLFFSPPDDFTAAPLVRPRLVLVFGHAGQEAAFADYVADEAGYGQLRLVSADEAFALSPVLRREGLLGGLVDDDAADIDVHQLQQSYLGRLRQAGGQLSTETKVSGLTRAGAGWEVECGDEIYRAAVVVNAGGAWAGEIGLMAGAMDIGLEPLRRTAALVEAATNDAWPLILGVGERFYAKPDAGLLLVSPEDETPSPPCDAYPDELDVAIAVDRLQNATTLEIRRVRSKWAGLRSFVEDRSPVVGFDVRQPGFFWLAALGGYGIQTAPALSRIAANLVLGRPLAAAELDIRLSDISPARLPAANLIAEGAQTLGTPNLQGESI
jgi:D-arginine dehydrogenase